MSRGRPAPERRRTVVRRVVLGLVVVWLAVCAFLGARTALALHRGAVQVGLVRQQLSAEDLRSGAALPALGRARSDFSTAHGAAANPALVPLHWVPILGRQARSVSALSAAAVQVAAIGQDVIGQAQTALSAPHSDGPSRLALLARMSALSASSVTRLRAVRLGPSAGLVGPLASRRQEFAVDLARITTAADRARGATQGLSDMLSGRKYLLLASNNDEMRAGSGVFLSVAELEATGGQFHLGPVRPAADLDLADDRVPIPGTQAGRWGWLHPNREWRNLGLTPQFDQTAQLAASMWEAAGGGAVDGVLAVDVEALKAMLNVTGPVGTDQGEVSAGNVEQLLFHDQYIGVTPDPSTSIARRDRLGAIANSALNAVEGGGIDVARLGTQLAAAATGRHILVWAARPDVEANWSAAGVGGVLPTDGLMVSMLNRGVNKLDVHLHLSAQLTHRPVGRDTEFTLHLTARNDAPDGEPPYVAGFGAAGIPPRTYLGLLAVDLPAAAGDVVLQPPAGAAVAGPDGTSQVVVTRLQLDPGQTATVDLRFVVGGHHGRFQVLPSARVPATPWVIGDQRFADSGDHAFAW